MKTTESVQDDQDRWSTFEENAQFPESFVPQNPGDSVVGEFVKHSTGTSKDGSSACDIVVLREKAGRERSVWLWQKVLRERLGPDADLKPGQLVYVEYRGRKISLESGHEYANYRIVVEGGEAASEEVNLHNTLNAPLAVNDE